MDEPTVSLDSETVFVDPEFVLVERTRYPTAEQVATLEPEDLDLTTDESESDQNDVAESEDALQREMGDTPGGDLEAELQPCTHPALGSIGTDRRPVSAPKRRKEGNGSVDTHIPPARRSQRTTAGTHKNPFNLPRPACNAMSLSPDVLSQVLAGMVLYTSPNLK